VAAGVSVMTARGAWERAMARFERLDLVLLAIATAGASLRLYRLAKPEGSLIFDECYYVQDARVILGEPVVLDHLPPRSLSGLDPNAEHPPLAKLLMALSMRLLGPTAFAWRLPSVLLGVVSIWAIYRLVLAIGGDRTQARFAAFVLAFENLSFVHGRIATLDVYVLAFMLLGTWGYVAGLYEVAGLLFGVATLCKVNGISGVIAILLFELGRTLREKRKEWRPSTLAPFGAMAAVYVAFTLCALGALDCLFTEFRSPLAHLAHVFQYGASLTRNTGGVQGAESTPLQWWLNEAPINYLMVQAGSNGVSTTTVLFRGAMNEYVVFAAPFALAFAAAAAWRGSRFGLLVLALFVANYGPVFFAWALASRISYIFYFLQSVPAIALGIALLVPATPRLMRWCFVAAVLFSFASWFPFRS
jgi:dolichyl-phosphate-mannose-protein mannosyltransferase